MNIRSIKFDEKGYVPVIVQDAENGQVLMFAYANQDALEKTIKTNKTLEEVYQVIEDRKRNPREGSYVSGLFKKGLDAILKKVGEEASETIVAGKNKSKEEVIYEISDLWFHSTVMLVQFGIKLEDIYQELGKRFGKSKEEYRENDSK